MPSFSFEESTRNGGEHPEGIGEYTTGHYYAVQANLLRRRTTCVLDGVMPCAEYGLSFGMEVKGDGNGEDRHEVTPDAPERSDSPLCPAEPENLEVILANQSPVYLNTGRENIT